jgi:hypothetical protein
VERVREEPAEDLLADGRGEVLLPHAQGRLLPGPPDLAHRGGDDPRLDRRDVQPGVQRVVGHPPRRGIVVRGQRDGEAPGQLRVGSVTGPPTRWAGHQAPSRGGCGAGLKTGASTRSGVPGPARVRG